MPSSNTTEWHYRKLLYNRIRAYSPSFAILAFINLIIIFLYANYQDLLEKTLKDPIPWFLLGVTLLSVYTIRFFQSNMRDIFGIDLVSGEHWIKDPRTDRVTRTASLFVDTSKFLEFQREAYHKLTNRLIDFLTVVLAPILTIILVYILLNPGEGDNIWTIPVSTNLITTLFQIYLIFWLFIVFVILTNNTILIGQSLVVINRIGDRREDLTLSNIDERLRHDIDWNQRSEIVRFSIRRFKRDSSIIPRFMLRYSILLLFFVTVISIALYTIISVADVFEWLPIALIFILGLIGIVFMVFLYPQLQIRDIIQDGKEHMIHRLEEMYELRKFQWLRLAGEESVQHKKDLWGEISILDSMIAEMETLRSWPFNYKQLLTLGGGSLVPILAIVAQVVLL